MAKATPYIRALRCSRKAHSSSRRSSGCRITKASTRSACSPTMRLQTVLSLWVPGSVTTYEVSPDGSHSISRSVSGLDQRARERSCCGRADGCQQLGRILPDAWWSTASR